jgi:hypothetical protein
VRAQIADLFNADFGSEQVGIYKDDRQQHLQGAKALRAPLPHQALFLLQQYHQVQKAR